MPAERELRQKEGFTHKEAERKLKQYGPNEIKDVSRVAPLKILLRQVKSNFVIYLLFAAMLISFFVGKTATAYTLSAIIFMVIIAGFVQEYRSEKAISALRSMLVPVSIAIRGGKEQEIPSASLVPGDVVVLRNGEKVPADCLVLEEKELYVNESVLTGESKEVRKKAGKEPKYAGENIVFMGAYLVSGRCVAKVLHTGMNTKFGKIAGLISSIEKELPLQRKVNAIAKYMVIIAITVSLLTGLLMLSRVEAIDADAVVNVLILVIALSVAAFPEGLPVVLIAALSSGAYRMARHNAIVNRMSIIETLGETTVICSDKTGTITTGEMTVKKLFAGNTFYDVSGAGYDSKGSFLLKKKAVDISRRLFAEHFFKAAVLCNDARIERTGRDGECKALGTPTESALLILAAKAGVFREDIAHARVQEIPFSSERKMMSVLCKVNNENIVYSKGAPEYLLRHCRFVQGEKGIARLGREEKQRILRASDSLAKDSFRMLALAYKKVDTFSKDNFEEGLVFTGLAAMEDPPREEVKKSLRQCLRAGIKVKMVTGDSRETALSIAGQIGLKGRLLTAEELDAVTDEELAATVSSIAIFARVRPEHKLRIVRALKARGEVVTMTGDGVNDAPALKEAHIGVAMGKSGTDVSRSVADLTLKDDNFSTIVLAIREGRTIFKNIRKFVAYQLSCNFAELCILFLGVLLSPLLGWQVPLLLALQILFMNLVTDNLPAITLGFTPASKDAMAEIPRKQSEILNKPLIGLLAFSGMIMTLLVLSTYFFTFNVMGRGVEYSRTAALLTLVSLEIVSAFNFRSFRKGIINRGLLANPYLFYASAVSFAATMAIIYLPLNRLFETVPLGADGFLVALVSALLLAIIFDLFKYLNNKKKFFEY